jgi:hypothetical protein
MKKLRTVALIALVCAILFPAGAAAQQLIITSPSAGTVIAPGQTLTVTVSVSSGSVLGVMVSAQDIGATGLQATAPYSFSLVIPPGVVGLKNLTALGFNGPDQAVTSAPVQIDVEAASAISIAASLPHIQFGFAGDQFPLRVTATFGNGSKLDVTGSTRTTFSSADITVATVDSTGLVTAVGSGQTTITLAYGQSSSTVVQVTVPTKVVGDLNGDGKVTADDLRILEAFVGTSAVGPFDARDLNGDGKIDLTDVQMLKNLCGSTCANVVSITATLLASSVNPSAAGQSIAFTASVSPAGTAIPTGAIGFLDGGAQIGTVILDNTGRAVFQTATLAAGTHVITASYGGDANSVASTSASLTQVVNGTPTSTALGSSLNPSVVGQSVTFTATVSGTGGTPTGAVTFLDGSTSLGTVGLTAGKATLITSALAIGSHSITAQYGGDSSFSGSTSSPALAQVVNGKPSATALVSSPSSEVGGQSVTFTATVTSTAGGTPTGTVTFFLNGTTSLGTGALNGSGVATLATTALAVGSPSITASYGGDANYAASTSAPLTENVILAGFAPISAPPPVTAGQNLVIPITVYAASGSGLTFTLSCVGLPAKASCLFGTNPVAPGPPPNGTVVQLTFETASSELPMRPTNRTPGPWWVPEISMLLAALFAAGMIRFRHAPPRRIAFGACLVVVALAIVLVGCANSSSPTYTGTPKGPVAFTVTGTSGATTISAPVSVTVQ